MELFQDSNTDIEAGISRIKILCIVIDFLKHRRWGNVSVVVPLFWYFIGGRLCT